MPQALQRARREPDLREEEDRVEDTESELKNISGNNSLKSKGSDIKKTENLAFPHLPLPLSLK